MQKTKLFILATALPSLLLSLPLHAADPDVAALAAEAAKYQSGASLEPLQKLEQLVYSSAGDTALRTRLEAELVKLLTGESTFEARRFACKQLMVAGTEASLPALGKLLADEQTASIACLPLAVMPSPKAAELLRSALPAAKGRVRVEIIDTLGDRRDPAAVPAMAALARDADEATARAAIAALGKIADAPARDALTALWKDAQPARAAAVIDATFRAARRLAVSAASPPRPSEADRQAAAGLYASLLTGDAPAHVRRGALSALMDLDADGGQKRIVELLERPDAALTPVAIARVSALPGKSASADFAALLPKLPPAQRAWLIQALAVRGDPPARDAILQQVTSGDTVVRSAAVSAAGELGDAAAVPALCKALAAASPADGRDVEAALIRLGGRDSTDQALLGELTAAAPALRPRLIGVLARRGARCGVPALLAEAGGTDAAVAQAAFAALGRLAEANDLPAMLDALANLKAGNARTDAETAAARVLAKLPDPPARSAAVLAARKKSSDLSTRCSFIRLLGKCGDSAALAAVTSAATDSDASVRDAAVRALADWPDSGAWDALSALVATPGNDTHRALAFRGLVRLAGKLNTKPDPALVDRYRKLLAAARDDNERKLVLAALSGCAHVDALSLAVGLLDTASVHAEAAQAVGKIAAAIRPQHPKEAQAALRRLQPPK